MVQITSSFVATVLIVAPAVLAAPVSKESFEAREPALSTGRIHEGLRPVGHRIIGSVHKPRPLTSARRPPPLRLGGVKNLGVREETEELELSAREPFSGRTPLSGGLSPSRRPTGLLRTGAHHLSASHTHTEHHSAGLGRRPISARLGSARRLGKREDVEEMDARGPSSGRFPNSGRLSPSRPHLSEHHALGRRPTGSASARLGSARLGSSRRLGYREDIEEIDAREPFSGRLPLSSRLSPSHSRISEHHTLGRRPIGFASPRLGSARLGSARRLGSREDAEEIDAREPIKAPLSAGRISPSLRASGLRSSARTHAPHTGEGRRLNNLHSHSQHLEAHRPSSARLSTGLRSPRRFATREDLEEFASRDVEEVEELSARDIEEIEELMAREPGVKEWFENLGKKIKGIFVKPKPKPAAAEAETGVAARSEDTEMSSLLQREVDLD